MTAGLRNLIKMLSLVVIDSVAFYGALLAAFYTRVLLDSVFSRLHVMTFRLSLGFFIGLWWLPVVFLFFILYERLYIKNLSFWDETRELIKSVSVATIAILAMLTIGRMATDISRVTVLLLWLYSLFLFPLFRFFGKKVLYKAGLWRENVIILGAGNAGIDTAKGIQAETHFGYNIIGFLDDDDDKIGRELSINGRTYKVFGRTKSYSKFIKMLNISTVIVALPSLPVEKLTELTNSIQKHTKNILLLPDLKGIALTNTELHHLFFQQLFLLKINNNLKSPFNRFIKRTFELFVSILFLPLLLPLIAVLGILIRIDSPGPILYRHERIGRRGRPFTVYKFRSMYRDSKERLEQILSKDANARKEWENHFKLKNDPRITKMGAFLRKTSLDELPQIFNVLQGNMSLVGPRPVIQEEITKYYKEGTAYYHLVRPGITGLWQVSGRSDIDYDVRVKLDTWYVLNWSLWLDILLLFKTIGVVIHREGAY